MNVIPKMAGKFSFQDPPKNWAFGLARDLETGNPLDREIVLRLVGRPHRFSELQPLLRGRGKNNLTQALRRLRFSGIIHMRTNFHAVPPFDYYELTYLGIRVVLFLAGREFVQFVSAHADFAPETASNS